MALSLRQRILRTSVASTLAIVFAAFLLADEMIRSTVTRDQRETLEAGARLVSQLQSAAVDDYVDRTAGLATAPTLRAAVETGDPSTIEENLSALLSGAEADWLAVTTPAGDLLAATAGAPPLERAGALIEAARFFDSAELWARDGRLEQVHASGIFFGSTQLGVVLSGVTIGEERIEQMEDATQQRVAFLANGAVAAAHPSLSSDARASLARAWSRTTGDSVPGAIREFELDGERHTGRAVLLPDGRGGVAGQLVTFRSLDAAMQPARTVRYALLGIAALGVVFALAASYLLARRVTRPVDRLLAETVRLGSGDLDTPIQTQDGDEIGRLGLGFDAMRQSLAAARDELVRAERLSAVGRAASAIVHDFKQPVAVISGHVELLRDERDERARKEDLDEIEEQVNRLTAMMGEVLDFARGGEGMRMAVGSVADLLEGVGRSMRPTLRDTGVELCVENGYIGLWTLDFGRTHRVLENLARNAAAALRGRGGHVTLRSARTEAGGLRLEVEDDGPGIPEEIRETLFEPFVTHGKREGTGLGLAIVKAFVERQGGTVDHTTSSAGTRFVVEFPAGGEA